jgi:hypothetical protein
VPEVEVVPMFSSQTLAEFVLRYRELRKMRIWLAETNSEIDNLEFFRELRELKNQTGSTKTSMEHSNPRGLTKSAVVEQLGAASQGNAFIRMDGVDDNGDILTGDNSHFNLRVPVERNEVEQNPARAGQHLREKFNELVDKGIVQVGAQPETDEGPGK